VYLGCVDKALSHHFEIIDGEKPIPSEILNFQAFILLVYCSSTFQKIWLASKYTIFINWKQKFSLYVNFHKKYKKKKFELQKSSFFSKKKK
jgi:hypothetical protein